MNSMKKKNNFPKTPYPLWKKILDAVLLPVMYLVSGTLSERPQQSHTWNFVSIPTEHQSRITQAELYTPTPVQSTQKWLFGFFPIFHIPLLGGWKHYHVLRPKTYDGVWHIAYTAGDIREYSLIPLTTPVRMLIGPDSVSFFGIDEAGNYIPVEKIGEGRIGDGGEFTHLPLL
jgi:hypothetical protein